MFKVLRFPNCNFFPKYKQMNQQMNRWKFEWYFLAVYKTKFNEKNLSWCDYFHLSMGSFGSVASERARTLMTSSCYRSPNANQMFEIYLFKLITLVKKFPWNKISLSHLSSYFELQKNITNIEWQQWEWICFLLNRDL